MQNEQGMALIAGCAPRIFSRMTDGVRRPIAYMLLAL